jgi:hypothetical protein
MRVVCLEQLSANPEAVAEEIFDFLGLSRQYEIPGRRNQTTVPTQFGRIYSSLKRKLDSSALSPMIQRMASAPWLQHLKGFIRAQVRRKKSSMKHELSATTIEKARRVLQVEYDRWNDSFSTYWS